MVRAALTEQCRPEKGMKSQRSEDDVDKQAYQLGMQNQIRLMYNSYFLRFYTISNTYNIHY